MQLLTLIFAQVYGGGPYGTCGYGDTANCATTANGGLLSNTGFDILLAATLAATIVFVALVIRFWKKPNKATKTSE